MPQAVVSLRAETQLSTGPWRPPSAELAPKLQPPSTIGCVNSLNSALLVSSQPLWGLVFPMWALWCKGLFLCPLWVQSSLPPSLRQPLSAFQTFLTFQMQLLLCTICGAEGPPTLSFTQAPINCALKIGEL